MFLLNMPRTNVDGVTDCAVRQSVGPCVALDVFSQRGAGCKLLCVEFLSGTPLDLSERASFPLTQNTLIQKYGPHMPGILSFLDLTLDRS